MAKPPAKPPITAPYPPPPLERRIGPHFYRLTAGDLAMRAFGWALIGFTVGFLVSHWT